MAVLIILCFYFYKVDEPVFLTVTCFTLAIVGVCKLAMVLGEFIEAGKGESKRRP